MLTMEFDSITPAGQEDPSALPNPILKMQVIHI